MFGKECSFEIVETKIPSQEHIEIMKIGNILIHREAVDIV
jgi:hypothetical protein